MACSVNMYFGERLIGNTFKVYYSESSNVEIVDYDCSMICTALGFNFDKFKLTEKELLSTGSYSTWMMYNATSQDPDNFGVQVFKELFGPAGYADLVGTVAETVDCIIDQNDATGVSQHMTQLNTQGQAELVTQMQIAFEWIKGVHDEYYGKKYLVEVGDDVSGVCIKDKFGNKPNFDLKVEAEGGLYYASDMPSPAGGWPNAGVTQILDLNIGPETLIFHEQDNRIGAFCKINDSPCSSGSSSCATQVKFGFEWEVDLSSVSDDAFYQKNGKLYIKTSVTESIYQINNKQYVLVDMSSVPRLRLSADATDCKKNVISQGATTLLTIINPELVTKDMSDAVKNLMCDDKDGVKRGAPHNRSALNLLNSHKPTVVPDAFVIPAKSNLFVYGPWFYQANPVGGTVVEKNNDLCPWRFSDGTDDGYARMNLYGGLIAYDGPRGLQKQESGSIKVASLPNYNIGFVVGTNAATLTDLNIEIGESGYTTTYNFQTYTPKFGSPGRALAGLWSKSYKSMSYINKFFKDQRLELNKLINSVDTKIQQKNKFGKNSAFNKRIDASNLGEPGDVDQSNSSSSPAMLLMSGYFFEDKATNASGGPSCHSSANGPDGLCDPCDDKDYAKPAVGPSSTASTGNILQNRPFANLEKGYTWEYVRENTFTRTAISTLDLILTPISTDQSNDTTSELPRLSLYESFNCSSMEYIAKGQLASAGDPPNSRPRLEMPPYILGSLQDLPIHQAYLNSVTSEQMLNSWDTRQNSSTKGFITHIIGYGDDFTDFNLNITSDNEDTRQQETNFRYNALRGPLTLQGWGYDTSGKPIPNAIDSAQLTEQGQFRRKGLKDAFMKNWLNNPKTWPAGPIDLRWDRERGVWVAPPANKIVVARLLAPLTAFGVATAELLNPGASDGLRFYQNYDIWGPEGQDVKQGINNANIKVYEYLGVSYCKCDRIYAWYDDGKYIVLESNRSYEGLVDSCCETTTTTTTTTTVPTVPPSTPDCWCDLDCLRTISNYKAGQHQALVHKIVGGADCLAWEDIVECVDEAGSATPSVGSDSASFTESDAPLAASSSVGSEGESTSTFDTDGFATTVVELGATALSVNPSEPSSTQLLSMLTASVTTGVIDSDADPKTLGHVISWIFNSDPFNFDYLGESETLRVQYLIDVKDSAGSSLLTTKKTITITIIGSNEGPVEIEIDETDTYLTKTGTLAYFSRSTKDANDGTITVNVSTSLTNIDTNTNRDIPDSTDAYRFGDDVIPSEADLDDMFSAGLVTSGTGSDNEEALLIDWSFDSDIGVSFRKNFNYMSKDLFLNLTYDVDVTVDGVALTTRQVIIKITGTNDAPTVTSISGGLTSGSTAFYNCDPTNTSLSVNSSVSGDIVLEDLDYQDGNITAEVVSMDSLSIAAGNLTLSEWEATSFWPTLSTWRNGMSISLTDDKTTIAQTGDSETPDTQALAQFVYSVPSGRDGSSFTTWLSGNDQVAMDFTLKFTDAHNESTTVVVTINIVGAHTNGTIDKALHTYSNGNPYLNDIVDRDTDGTDDSFFLYEDGDANVSASKPHYMEYSYGGSNTAAIYVFLQDGSSSSYSSVQDKDVFAFGKMEIQGMDFSRGLNFQDSGSTTNFSNDASAWDTKLQAQGNDGSLNPKLTFAMNLESGDIHNPDSYEDSIYAVLPSKGTSNTWKNTGEQYPETGILYWCAQIPKENFAVSRTITNSLNQYKDITFAGRSYAFNPAYICNNNSTNTTSYLEIIFLLRIYSLTYYTP